MLGAKVGCQNLQLLLDQLNLGGLVFRLSLYFICKARLDAFSFRYLVALVDVLCCKHMDPLRVGLGSVGDE